MTIYLHDIPLPQAQARLDEALHSAGLQGLLEIEEILVGRVGLARKDNLQGPPRVVEELFQALQI